MKVLTVLLCTRKTKKSCSITKIVFLLLIKYKVFFDKGRTETEKRCLNLCNAKKKVKNCNKILQGNLNNGGKRKGTNANIYVRWGFFVVKKRYKKRRHNVVQRTVQKAACVTIVSFFVFNFLSSLYLFHFSLAFCNTETIKWV